METLDSLGAILNGETVAIHMYDSFIPKMKDLEMKNTFQTIRTGHRRHLDQITRRIEELGHRPRIQLGLRMKIGEFMIDARTRVGIAPDKMSRWALKGEDMGITATEEVIKGDLDEVSKELVGIVLGENRDYINQLMEFINK